MTILNQFEVSDNITTSGQPTQDQFSQISASGHSVVINLAMPDHENSISNEGEIVTSLGMTYIHIPVPFEAPKEYHYEMFCGYMDSLRTSKVWIHCIVNARVSAFLYRYLQSFRGYSEIQATTPILEAWLPQMDKVWSKFIGHEQA
jgi:protein tyrosine phosphatase (PTP) superfamily phosphohydrolase (DUF442 family)